MPEFFGPPNSAPKWPNSSSARRRISPTPPSFRAPLPRSQTCVETAVPSILVQHYLIVSSRTCVLHWCPIHAEHTRAPWLTLSRPRPTPTARPHSARIASRRGRAYFESLHSSPAAVCDHLSCSSRSADQTPRESVQLATVAKCAARARVWLAQVAGELPEVAAPRWSCIIH